MSLLDERSNVELRGFNRINQTQRLARSGKLRLILPALIVATQAVTQSGDCSRRNYLMEWMQQKAKPPLSDAAHNANG